MATYQELFAEQEQNKRNLPQTLDGSGQSTLSKVGRGVTGLATEVAIGESAKYGLATLGAASGPLAPILAPTGYVLGGLGGGAVGSISSQRIQDPEAEISWGRVIADSLINLIPASKAIKGGTLLARGGKAALREGVQGGVIGLGGETIETALDENRLPTAEELATAGISSALFGSALGVSGQVASKFLGRNIADIDQGLLKGDKDTVALVNGYRKVLGDTYDPMDTRNLSYITPSKTVGKNVLDTIEEGLGQIKETKATAGLIRKRLETGRKKSTDPVVFDQAVNRFITGQDQQITPELEQFSNELNYFRGQLRNLQKKALDNDETGQKILPDITKEAINDSLTNGDYLTRTYRFFEDPTFNPDPKARAALKKELMTRKQVDPKTGLVSRPKTSQEAEAFLSDLEASRIGTGNQLETIAAPFKGKKALSQTYRNYLGEITDPSENLENTLNRLARATVYDETDFKIKEQLMQTGFALKDGDEIPQGWEPLKLRREQEATIPSQEINGKPTKIWVPSSFNTAMKELYVNQGDELSQNVVIGGLQDLYQSGVSASKAVKVLGNIPSYAVQVYGNMTNLIGQGINPFRKAGKATKLAASLIPATREAAIKSLSKQGVNSIDEIAKLQRHNILDASVFTEDVKAGLKKGKVGAALDKIITPFGQVYSHPDNTGRIVGYYHNKDNVVKKLFPNVSEETAEEFAAEITNDTYQNYGKLSSLVKRFSRMGILGQFSAFPLELARNQYNQTKIALEMMRGTFGEGRLNLGPADLMAMRKEGAKRMGSLLSIYAATTAGVGYFNRQNGVDSEKEKAFRETVAPEWDEQKTLGITLDDKGNATYTNLSYQIPHAQLIGIVASAMKGETMEEAFGKLASATYDEIGGEGTFVMQNMMAALANVDFETRKAISDDPNKFISAMKRMGFFTKETFSVGEWREIKKAMENPASQTLLRHGGIRINNTTIDKGASFRVRKVGEQIRGLNSRLASARRNGSIGQFQRGVQTHQALFQEVAKHGRNLQTLGKTSDEAIATLVNSGISRKMAVGAVDGVYIAPEFEKQQGIGDIVDELDSLGKDEKITALKGMDVITRRKVLKQMQVQARRKDWTERDKYVYGLGSTSGERANHVLQGMSNVRDPKVYLRSLYRKKVINDEDLRIILGQMG